MPQIREVYPYLIVRGAAAAIEFYRTVFGAEEIFRLPEDEKGRIGHAELRLGPVTIMLADEHPELGLLSPLAHGGTGTTLHLHVDDVDALAADALRGAMSAAEDDHLAGVREPGDHRRNAERADVHGAEHTGDAGLDRHQLFPALSCCSARPGTRM